MMQKWDDTRSEVFVPLVIQKFLLQNQDFRCAESECPKPIVVK